MKLATAILTAIMVAAPLTAATPQTSDGQEHKIVQPQEIEWGPAPAALPAGAQVAVLLGDPSKQGLFAMRLKVPKGYSIPPHSHPAQEVVTVVSGTINLGMEETADQSKTKALPVGTFYVLPIGMAHFARFDEETVLQVNTIGPWGINTSIRRTIRVKRRNDIVSFNKMR